MGMLGEQAARRYLEDQGYEILETNWRLGRLEADIIAYKDHTIVFVEVKTRRNETFGTPEMFVDRKKQVSCIRLANAYVLQNHRTEEVRFDIVTVVLNQTGCQVNHIPNAFTTIG